MSGVNVDEWFKVIRQKYAAQMQCGKGCTACCHGLFVISLGDAVEVARGFQELPPDTQRRVHARAAALHDAIRQAAPEAPKPAFFGEDDPRIDHIIETANNPPCPCLGDAGECLIYDRRPLSCRLEGAPMIDARDGLFGDWCELNFKQGIPDAAIGELTQDYNIIDAADDARSAEVARRAGLPDPRAVTFIPSVIAEFESFWKLLPFL
jgi:Fe-S-cluster containining protein